MPISRYGGITGSKKISEDFDNINTAFNNVATEADTNKATVDGHIANGNLHTTLAEKTKLAGITAGAGGAGSASDVVIGNRTIADTTAPTGDTGTITTLLGWLSNMIKAITGKSSWRTAPATTLEAANTHMNNSDLHTSVAEHTKLAGIQAGAEVNQKAFSQVNNIPAGDKSDTLTVTGGTGITVTNNPATKTMIVTATGTATPGAHASSHLTGGSDPIPVATTTAPGLMSADDRKRMDTEATTAVILSAGQQILNATKNARLQGLKVQGRTLIPLLSDGFELDSNSDGVADGWAAVLYGATPSLVSINGGKAQRITSTAADTGTSRRLERNITVESGKRYVALVDVVTDGTSLAYLAAASGTSTITNASSVTSAATKTHSVKFMPTTSGTIILRLYNYNGLGTVGWVQFDSLRVIEVSASDYTSFDSMTSDQIAQRWPFVPPGINGVDGLWVRRYGKNLLPSVPDTLHANAKMNGPYDMTLAGTSTFSTSRFKFPVIPGKQYTFKADHNGVLEMAEYDANDIQVGATSQTTSVSITRTIQASTSYVQCRFTNSATGTFNFKDWQLEIGSTVTPFQPREDSLIAFSGVELHANPNDGSEPDILREVNGRYEATKLWREMVLDGSLPWAFQEGWTGFKRVKLASGVNVLSNTSSSAVTKFNGVPLAQALSDASSYSAADVFRTTTGSIVLTLTIASADSGWGDTYTPSTDEIKAYFNGYQMGSVSGATFTTPYISGTKAWRFVMGDTSTGTSTLPTDQNYGYVGWKPYQLLYRLASPITETVQEDGALSLLEGDNFIEVGSGYVSRELTKPVLSAGYYEFNNSNSGLASGKFRYAVSKILSVFEDSKLFFKWTRVAVGAVDTAFGERINVSQADYSPGSPYSASYIKLDKSPVPGVTGFYAATEKGQLHDLTDAVTEIGSAVSVLAVKKAEKDAGPWITPSTLLNGFTGNQLSYRKNGNYVEFKGFAFYNVIDAPGGTIIMNLPAGFRPLSFVNLPTTSWGDTGALSPSAIGVYVGIDGIVQLSVPSKRNVLFDGLRFPLD